MTIVTHEWPCPACGGLLRVNINETAPPDVLACHLCHRMLHYVPTTGRVEDTGLTETAEEMLRQAALLERLKALDEKKAQH